MKVYVAAPWVHKAAARVAQQQLACAGFTIVSQWVDTPDHNQNAASIMEGEARMDRDDVHRADAIVLLNLAKSEGKATEFGMALAWGKRCVIVGPKEGNVFYALPEVEIVSTVADAIHLLARG